MQGLYQLSRLTKCGSVQLPALPSQRFYRLWIVEDHAAWSTGNPETQVDLAQTLWFFPKHFKPGIPHQEVEGFTFWFDDLFLRSNPLLTAGESPGPWGIRKPFVLSELSSFQTICNLCRDHQAYLKDHRLQQHPLAYATATMLLLHLREAAAGQFTLAAAQKKTPLVDSFLSLLQKHFSQQHQPYFYAEALHVTVDTLRRYCRETFSQSPTELIQQKLLEESKKRLLESDLSIKQIAYELGFEDESYFVRFFRQQALLPPRAYRRCFLINQ